MRKSMTRKGMLVVLGALTLPSSARACYYHWLLGLKEPTGDWPALPSDFPYNTGTASPTDAATAVSQLQSQDALDDAAVTNAAITPTTVSDAQPLAEPAVTPVTSAAITSWMVNTTNTYAYSTNSTIESDVGSYLANVQLDAYSSTEVYIKTTGLPSYNLGPFPTDPNAPTNQNRTFEATLNPTPNTGTPTATALGPIGLAVNGVAIFNPWDGNYYNASTGTSTKAGYWQQNANVFEASSFDIGPGHPAPGGTYHYHESPTELISQLDPSNTGQHASPVIGYANDGYPIFGPYGYVVDANGNIVDGSNGQPEIELMTSSYQLNTYPNGVRPDGGPTTSAKADGSYLQDYTYNAGAGTLNQYNMRYAVAPGYSTPTWGYYVTSTYPYVIGPDYYGNVDTKDLAGGSITVPSGVSYFVPGTSAVTGTWNVDAAGNWSSFSNWSGSVPNGTDSIASFGSAITASRTITVDSAQTVGTINFSSAIAYTIAGSSTLSMNVSTGQNNISVSAGSPTISAPLALLANTTITVTPSTSDLTLSNLQASAVNITIAGSGEVSVNNLRAGSLNISSGTVAVVAGGTNASTSVLSMLTIAAGAKLDLANNSLILHNGSIGAITAMIASGYNAGTWTGTGIISSSAHGDTTLGILLNNASGGAIYSTFEGQTASLNDVLIKYTYYGDTNLDGKVDGSDYSRIDASYLSETNGTAITGWSNGDFNYDNVVNGSDYTLIDNAFNSQGAQLTAMVASPEAIATAQVAGSSAVPEPGIAGFLAIGSLAMLRRRRMKALP